VSNAAVAAAQHLVLLWKAELKDRRVRVRVYFAFHVYIHIGSIEYGMSCLK